MGRWVGLSNQWSVVMYSAFYVDPVELMGVRDLSSILFSSFLAV